MCHCNADRVPLYGACVSTARARRACLLRGAVLQRFSGSDGAPESGAACVPLRCPAGEVPDETTGSCLAPGVLRAIAAKRGVSVGEHETLGCFGGGRVRAAWGLPFCFPKDESCAPVEEKRAGACATAPICPAAYVLEPSTSKCLRLSIAGRDAPTFDVATWARCAIGLDGGEGAHPLCAMIARDASGFEAPPFDRWRLSFELRFPNNEIAGTELAVRVSARASGEQAAAERAAPAWLAAAATRAGDAIVDDLRALGGSSSAAHLDASVWCSVRHAAPPIALPLENAASSERSAGTIK
jgi:hypothetical protein